MTDIWWAGCVDWQCTHNGHPLGLARLASISSSLQGSILEKSSPSLVAHTFTLHPLSLEWWASTQKRIPMHLNVRMSLLVVRYSMLHRLASSAILITKVIFVAKECPTWRRLDSTLASGQRVGVEPPVKAGGCHWGHASFVLIVGNLCTHYTTSVQCASCTPSCL